MTKTNKPAKGKGKMIAITEKDLNSSVPVKTVNMVLMGKFSDGTVRQFIFNENAQKIVLNVLAEISPTKSIQVLDTVIDTLNWESEIDLSK
jgi:hypothetical protein